MNYDDLIQYIQTRIEALKQRQTEMERTRDQLWQQHNAVNEKEIWTNFDKMSLDIWECRGMQKAYYEIWAYLAKDPSVAQTEPKIMIKQETQPRESSSSQNPTKETNVPCPKCSGNMIVTTSIEPAPKPGYITIVSHYECQACDYQESEQVDLPKEIALQKYNLSQLIKGV